MKKTIATLAAAASVGLFAGALTLITPTSAEAQYYGGGYGYNNGRPNSYGNYGPYNSSPRYNSPAYNSQQRGYGGSRCSQFSMSNYGC